MKSILVAVDFSEASLSALNYAAKFADSVEAELKVLSVSNSLRYEPIAILGNISQNMLFESNAVKEKLEKAVAKACKNLKVKYKVFTSVGVPEVEIQKFAQRHNVSLVVMGQTGNNGLKRFFLGSTTSHLINTSSNAIMIIPKGEKFKVPKNILFATDLEPVNVKYLRPAIDMAKYFGSTLTLLYIDTEGGYDAEEKIAKLEKLIDKKYKYNKIKGVVAADLFVKNGLDAYASRHKCDLLVTVKYHPAFSNNSKTNFSTTKITDSFKYPVMVFEHKK